MILFPPNDVQLDLYSRPRPKFKSDLTCTWHPFWRKLEPSSTGPVRGFSRVCPVFTMQVVQGYCWLLWLSFWLPFKPTCKGGTSRVIVLS